MTATASSSYSPLRQIIRPLPISTGILPAHVTSRFLSTSSDMLTSLTAPLQPELWPLVLLELGLLLATIFAGFEAWSTTRWPKAVVGGRGGSAGGGGAAISAAGGTGGRSSTGQNRIEEGRGGAGGANAAAAAAVPPPQQQGRSRGQFRRGSNDTETGTTPPHTPAMSQRIQTDKRGSSGPQSSGDKTRRSFFHLIFLALLSRFVLLPIQAFYFSPTSEHIHHDTGLCMSSPACIFSRTLPDLAFASAFSLLVLFYAQLAGTASGGGPRGLSFLLMRKRLFPMGNAAVYALYGLLFFFTAAVPLLPYALFQTIVWSMLCLIYGLLLCLLSYFGPVLVKLLRPSLARRSALAYRLIAMCVICISVFLSRTICFGVAVWQTDYRWTRGILSNVVSGAGGGGMSQFDQNVLGYALLELLPSVAILAMMHQRRPRGGSSTSPSAAAGTTPPTNGIMAGGGGGGGVAGRNRGGQQHSPASLDGGMGVGGGGMRRIPSGSAPKRAVSARTGMGIGVGATSSSEGVALLGDRNAAAASSGGAYGTAGI